MSIKALYVKKVYDTKCGTRNMIIQNAKVVKIADNKLLRV